MNHEAFDSLPSRAGVYKFQDYDGKTIYVGKAKNIKKRVISHFRCNSEKEIILCKETFSLDFELTGNELIALLLEAELIQKHLPKFNTVQKKSRSAFYIKVYHNRMGITQLATEERPLLNESCEIFYSKGAVKKKLEKLCEEFNLCPKFTGLQRKKGRCSHVKFPFCAGVCCDEEDVGVYNRRVDSAIASLKANTQSYIIYEKGRRHSERSFILVLEGVYQGFGYVDGSQQVCGANDLLDIIVPKKQTYHTAQILSAYRKKNPIRVKIIEVAIE